MNKAIFVGRLTKEPELRTTQNGISVARFTVAVTRRKSRDESDYITVITWRGLADNCAKYLVKGQQVSVVGELRTRVYEAKDGSGKRYVTEVQADEVEFLAKPGANGGTAGNREEQGASFDAPGLDRADIFEDENLPF